jgi:biopolymer transport protein TolR
MIKPRKKHHLNVEMNVVPYIDVMLVLLVIFMVTAPMLPQGIKIDLPNVNAGVMAAPSQQRIVTLSIKADGSYYWNVGDEIDTSSVSDRAVDLPQLQHKLAQLVAQQQNLLVYVRADETASYALIARAMAAVQHSGVTNLGLITEEQP